MAPQPPPFSTDPTFSDVLPLPQDDGLRPLAQITYPPAYVDSTSYLRALAQREEFSPRTLTVTERVISGNPAHYTAWHMRAETFIRMGDKEAARQDIIQFLNPTAKRYEKNYQIWRYREVIVGFIGSAEGELEFIDEMLAEDCKNYHVWSYRQWLVRRFGLWDEDLPRCERLINEDVRNNSAWNHRFFNVFARGGDVTPAILNRELEFAKEKASLAPQNASAWAYLRGVLGKLPASTLQGQESFCQQFLSDPENLEETVSTPAVEMLVDIWVARGDVERAKKGLETLEKLEPIRKGYWRWKKAQVGGREQGRNVGASCVPVAS